VQVVTLWRLIAAVALSGVLLFDPLPASAEDDVSEAMEIVNRQIAANPRDGRLLVQRARLQALSRKFDQALSDLDAANRLTALPEIDRERAQIYLAAGWNETGLEHANRHLAKFPEDPEAYLIRGRMRAKLGQRAEAGADLGACLARMKDPPLDLYLERASILTTEDGAYLGDALVALEQGIKRLGHVITLETAALEVELQQRNYQGALQRLDALIERAPRKETWVARRGDVLVQAGRMDDARSAYQQALGMIAQLTPAQRARPGTKTLEEQLKTALTNSTELAMLTATNRNTRLLSASTPAQPAAPPDGLPASTNTPALPSGGKTRTYFIAAEEVDWHYAPGGNVLMEPFCADPDAFARPMPGRIGLRYKKAIYRGYTDATFQRLQVASPQWQHLGMLGPLMRAEVGDRLRVTFRNKTRFPASIHPHGVFYLKTSEGSGYSDGTAAADKKDDVVSPGGSVVYEWLVPERAGPGPADGSSLVWLYHSHVQGPKDINAGLIGAIIVTAKGRARPDGTPLDVDREFVTLFNIYDENQSAYFDVNLKAFLGPSSSTVNTNDLLFIESNKKHTINGFIFANLPLLTMKQGEHVRWYLLGMGGESDLHTPHWHGNSVLCQGRRTDVVELLPASMKVADMIPDNPGVWMYHCHVNDHMAEGMSARFQVTPQEDRAVTAR